MIWRVKLVSGRATREVSEGGRVVGKLVKYMNMWERGKLSF